MEAVAAGRTQRARGMGQGAKDKDEKSEVRSRTSDEEQARSREQVNNGEKRFARCASLLADFLSYTEEKCLKSSRF